MGTVVVVVVVEVVVDVDVVDVVVDVVLVGAVMAGMYQLLAVVDVMVFTVDGGLVSGVTV